MKVRFQADADLKHAIVNATLRREPTLDFQTAAAADLAGRDDSEVLAIAARDGRVLVSHDHRTMPSHFGEFTSKNASPGVVNCGSVRRSRSRASESLTRPPRPAARGEISRRTLRPIQCRVARVYKNSRTLARRATLFFRNWALR